MPDFYKVARKILFSLDAERAHHWTLEGLRLAHRSGLLPFFTPHVPDGTDPVTVMGLTFPNRVGLAAGMDKGARAVAAFGALGFGHVEVGTVTPRPQPGNPTPRLFRLIEHRAIINRMGFNNPGIDQLLHNLAESRYGYRGIVGVNLGKNFDTPNENAISDYVTGFRKAYGAAGYIAVNLSSPNTKGLRDLQTVDTCRSLIGALQEEREQLKAQHGGKHVPIAIKIAPDLADDAIRDLAGVFNELSLDGVIATNTTIARDAVQGHVLAHETGGLSGAPLTKRATEVIAHLRQHLAPTIPIIGVGGILTAQDAQEKLQAGAALVQVYTGLVYRGPALLRDIVVGSRQARQ